MKYLAALVGVSPLLLCACQSQQQMVDQMQPNAVQMAQKRATYLVVCAEEGTGCVAGGAHNETQ